MKYSAGKNNFAKIRIANNRCSVHVLPQKKNVLPTAKRLVTNKTKLMKNLKSNVFSGKFMVLFAALFMNFSAFAQLDVDIDLGKEQWYENPLVWVGVAAFLLILVLLLRKK